MTPRFSPSAVRAFELLFRPWMRRRVHAVRVAGLLRFLAADRPLLLAANHVSWWDGFVLREVQRILRPGAPMYTVMGEAELRRFPFFRRLGVVGIEADRPSSIAKALRFLEGALRERPNAVVIFFPQGRIWPSYRRPLGFERGVELFAQRLPVAVLPVGIHAEPLNRVAPTLFVSAGAPLEAPIAAQEVERRVEGELDAILAFLAEHGEAAAARWPGARDRLPATPSAARWSS